MGRIVSPDIVVIGAGAAGIAAACAAAQAGAAVVLLDKSSEVGGLATMAMVGTICGAYLRSERDVAIFAMSGFPREFVERLATASASFPLHYLEGLFFLPYQIEAFSSVARSLLHAAQVEIFSETEVISAKREGRSVSELTARDGNGLFHIRPKAVIDCSGDAVVAQLLETPVHAVEQAQASALVFEVSALPPSSEAQLRMLLSREIIRGRSSGRLPHGSERLSLVPGSTRSGRGLFKLGLSPEESSNGAPQARERARQICELLSAETPELHDMHITRVAPWVGRRHGLRVVGRELLTESMVLNTVCPADHVAIGAWPIEFWGAGREPEMAYFAAEGYYGVPAGSLCSADFDNLFCAGKTISADARAIASARVMGTCLSTGYAAGMLAEASLRRELIAQTAMRIRSEICGTSA